MFNKLRIAIACFGLASTLTACPPTVTTGSLTVTISGAPSGTSPSITVTGPNSFWSTVTETTTIPKLELGQYTIQANTLTSSNLEYAGAIKGSPATVSAGAMASASVTYAKSAMLISSLSDAGAGSLRDTIATTDTNIVKLTSAGTIALKSPLEISKNLTIEGPATGGLIFSGTDSTVMLNVKKDTKATFKNITFQDSKNLVVGDAPLPPLTPASLNTRAAWSETAAIQNFGNLTLENVNIQGNTNIWGTVVNFSGANLTLSSGSIQNNIAICSGGGVFNYGGTFTMKGGSIKSNKASDASCPTDYQKYGGGGVINWGGTFNLEGGSIEANTSWLGGGVFNGPWGNAVTNIKGGSIKNNKALSTAKNQGFGGGIFTWTTTTLNITGGSLETNTADLSGGGIYNIGTFIMLAGNVEGNSVVNFGAGIINDSKGTFTFSGGTIQNNISTGAVDPQISFGGGVCNSGIFTMSSGTIKGNKVTRAGAGVYNDEGATFTMTDGIIEANKTTGTVDNGGGGVLNYLGTFKMSGGTIQDNTSMYAGGVNNWGTFEMTGGTVKNNTAANGAGGVGNTRAAAVFKLIQGIISGNTGAYGGGIKNTGSFIMTGGIVSGNTATQDGAGIHNSDGGSGITAVIAVIQGGVIENNTATRNGGGIMNYKAGITIGGGTTRGNSAIQGAGLWTGGDTTIPGSATLTGGTISSNTASQSGGGVFRNVNGTFSNTGSTVSGNTPNDVFPTP
jgi:hypothetical protein